MTTDVAATASFGLGRAQVRAAVAFVITVIVALVVVNATGYHYMNPREFLRSTLALYSYDSIEEPYDVVMVGSSRLEYSVDSRLVAAALEDELGEPVSVYKLTQHGLRPWLLYSVLRDFVREQPPTELLVVGMGLQFFNDQRAKATAIKQVGSLREWAAADLSDLTADQWTALLQLPFRGVHVMWNVDWALASDVVELRDYQATHGGELSAELEAGLGRIEQFRFLRRMVSEGRYNVLPKRDERLDIEPFDEVGENVVYDMDSYWFRKVLDLLEELPCDVLLVRTPVKAKFLNSITPDTRREFDEVIVRDIERRGFGYENLNRAPFPQEDRFFQDVVHMTVEGRRMTSDAFARDVLAPLLRAR